MDTLLLATDVRAHHRDFPLVNRFAVRSFLRDVSLVSLRCSLPMVVSQSCFPPVEISEHQRRLASCRVQ